MSTNQNILNAIWNEANKEYQSVITMAKTAQGVEVYDQLNQYPTMKNMFIQDFINKIVLQKLNDELWMNPLKSFKKGKLGVGQSIENIFVEDQESIAFGDHFTGSTTEEGDVFGKAVPNVKTHFMSVNMMNKYKVSISNAQLKTAFLSEMGLSQLALKLVNSIYQRAEKDDYGYTLYCLYNTIGIAAASTNTDMFIDIGGELNETTAKKVLNTSRALAGRFKFPSRKYNVAGVETFSNPKNLVFLSTPENIATLDVMALANVFNLDKADIKYRVLDVHELPKFTDTYTPIYANKIADPETGKYTDVITYTVNEKLQNAIIDAIIVDEDLIQLWDTENQTRTFENPNNLVTNYFLHKHGIAAANYYKQFAVLYHIPEVEGTEE